MASAPKASLPIFYNDLLPLSGNEHNSYKALSVDKAVWVAKQNVVPLTVEEFPPAQRDFPIIFSTGDNPVPLAVMGLNEGSNTFFEEDGTMIGSPYVPAYIRRYPFLLARLREGDENLSLCFDPTSNLVGDYAEGSALFNEDRSPTQHTQDLLKFCQQFEEAGLRTRAFMDELVQLELLMDGEVAINRLDGSSQPFIYRGFKMVDESKLRALRGDQLRKMTESGLLGMIYAHLFSLDLLRLIFARADAQGKVPAQPVNIPA